MATAVSACMRFNWFQPSAKGEKLFNCRTARRLRSNRYLGKTDIRGIECINDLSIPLINRTVAEFIADVSRYDRMINSALRQTTQVTFAKRCHSFARFLRNYDYCSPDSWSKHTRRVWARYQQTANWADHHSISSASKIYAPLQLLDTFAMQPCSLKAAGIQLRCLRKLWTFHFRNSYKPR